MEVARPGGRMRTLGLVLLGLGIFAVGVGFHLRNPSFDQTKWATTKGWVKVYGGLKVIYMFTIQGKLYMGSAPEGDVPGERVGPGTPVRVYYDPAAPRRHTLRPEPSSAAALSLAFFLGGGVAALIGLGCLFAPARPARAEDE